MYWTQKVNFLCQISILCILIVQVGKQLRETLNLNAVMFPVCAHTVLNKNEQKDQLQCSTHKLTQVNKTTLKRSYIRLKMVKSLLFAGKFLWKDNNHFSSWSFLFIFLIFPMTRTIVVRVVGVLYNTCIGCHRGWGSRGGGFESRHLPYFLHFSRYSSTQSCFIKAKNTVFFDKVQSFW